MKRPLNEEKALKKLGIEDFRHLSKDKVIDFISLIPEMDPEVAKAAIAQFPEFSSTMKSIMVDYKATLEKALNGNEENVKAYYEACNTIIASLDKLLAQDDFTNEEKLQIVDKMQEIQKMMHEKDTENKKFLRDIAAIAGLVVVTVTGIAAALLGGDSDLKLPGSKD
ncbi:MAG: hypothetical protein IJ731_01920 [Eubacterium sp.]|nr:hypothetical protein [Eubacterium sp.]